MTIMHKLPAHETRLVIRIGVIGYEAKEHGVNSPNSSLLSKIKEALGELQDAASALHRHCKGLYGNSKPSLRVISPLGEGAEQIVSRVADNRKIEIQCILPTERNEYSEAFLSAESRILFDELWEACSVRVELDGTADNKPAAREEARHAVLRQCDVLMAIWDGQREERKGAGAIVAEALSRKIPILWINSLPDHEVCILERGPNVGDHPRKSELSRLFVILKPIFEMPKGVDPESLKRFLSEKQRKPFKLYKRFRALIARGWEKRISETHQADASSDLGVGDPWARLAEPNSLIGRELCKCRERFERTDYLAGACADTYRSLFIMTYGLGAAAVLAAFFGIYYKKQLSVAFWVELVFISAILVLVWLGNNRLHLHERWIDYRLLAEGLRQMQYLIPLARVTPAFDVPAHLEEDPGKTWFNWHFRAVARDLGMVSARMDADFRETYRKVLAAEVKSQVKYHTDTSAIMELAHHRLHFLVVKGLFPATLIACILHLLLEKIEDYWLNKIVTAVAIFLLSLCAVVLPAIGAAVEGISHQGEFERIARRSKALRGRLSSLLKDLSNPARAMSSKELGAQAEYFCQIQLLEQADWRAAFVSKPLTPS